MIASVTASAQLIVDEYTTVQLFTNLDISLAELADSNLKLARVRWAAGRDAVRKSFGRSREKKSCKSNPVHRDYSRRVSITSTTAL